MEKGKRGRTDTWIERSRGIYRNRYKYIQRSRHRETERERREKGEVKR
mgnify:CR=1 FL=1